MSNWLCSVLGYEALHILQFVRQFSAICVCIFSSDLIIGRNVYVSVHPIIYMG